MIRRYLKIFIIALGLGVSLTNCNSLSNSNPLVNTIVEGSEKTILVPKKNNAGVWGYVDATQNWVIEPKYKDAWMFSKGMGVVQVSENKCGLINTKGEWIIEPNYQSILTFVDAKGETYFNVEKDNVNTLFDAQGKEIFSSPETVFSSEVLFDEGLYMRTGDNGLFGFINNTGKWAISPTYLYASDFSDGVASVSLDEKTRAIIDHKGDVITRFANDIDYVGVFRNGLAPARKNEKYGYINKKGDTVIEFKYLDAKEFNGGVAFATDNDADLWQCIDTQGNVVFEITSSFIVPMGHGYIQAHKEGKVGIINTKGEIVLPFIYDLILNIEQQRYVKVKLGKEYYYIDLTKGTKY